uniref:Uncharacterized protein n=1 Tax=Anguilla anguilla TaxID=7936 RepID=A0A0E9TTB6_ANGAN
MRVLGWGQNEYAYQYISQATLSNKRFPASLHCGLMLVV